MPVNDYDFSFQRFMSALDNIFWLA